MNRVLSIPFEDYCALKGRENWSKLKFMALSPKHYKHAQTAPDEDSTARKLGRGTHTAVLEPDRFPLDYAVFSGPRRAGVVWDAFEAAHPDQTILKANEYATCLAMRDAVRSNPAAMEYLRKGKPEQTIVWTDDETGLPCKARIDWLNADRPVIADLKTTGRVDSFWFGRHGAKMQYHCQLGHYYNGVKKVLGVAPRVVIIAVEDKPPHDSAVFVVDGDALEAGRETVAELLARVKFHRNADTWPGRYDEEQGLELPPWTWGDEEEGATEGLTFGGQ